MRRGRWRKIMSKWRGEEEGKEEEDEKMEEEEEET